MRETIRTAARMVERLGNGALRRPRHDTGAPDDHDRLWFFEHYDGAAGQIAAFLAGAGATLEGKRVADIGCGDGMIDLGLVHRSSLSELVGFDIVPTDTDELLRRARRYELADILPANLSFRTSDPTRLPSDDATFDVVVTWSAFEHVGNPLALLTEVRRIIRSDGVLFLQVWPFYHSERGSHLWEWCPEGFHHLVDDEATVVSAVRGAAEDSAWGENMISEFRALNRITLDDLHHAIKGAGFAVRKLELLSNTVLIPPGLEHHPLSSLGIAGVKLLAVPV